MKWIQIDIENILVVLFLIFALIDCLKLQFNTLVLVKIHQMNGLLVGRVSLFSAIILSLQSFLPFGGKEKSR